MATMNYAAFLAWLLSFKDELPAILNDIQAAVELLMSAYQRVKGTLPAESFELTDEEASLETDVAVAVAGPNAAFDGTKLRAAWKFLNDSGLLPIIVSLLTK